MNTNRRNFIISATAIGLSTVTASFVGAESSEEEAISATEDLMREHGVLDRVLLIYEEGIRRIKAQEELDPDVFQHSAALVRKFVENYHEKLEEGFIFPTFTKAEKHSDVVTVLKQQHNVGRSITDAITRLSTPAHFREPDSKQKLVSLCESFIRMYRPHAAREDTVLFPALRDILSAKQIDELGEQFEEEEHRLFGDEGFKETVEQVATIEKQLHIYDLAQFTPTPPDK